MGRNAQAELRALLEKEPRLAERLAAPNRALRPEEKTACAHCGEEPTLPNGQLNPVWHHPSRSCFPKHVREERRAAALHPRPICPRNAAHGAMVPARNFGRIQAGRFWCPDCGALKTVEEEGEGR